ncbi:MAG TPA: cupin domain-containing protein [Rhizomicrobium sp.]|jgi:mannose-6-phosphate isomerase-like protein (cupin superfamily)
MKRLHAEKTLILIAALLLTTATAQAQTLASRVTHYDVSKTANLKAVHDGAGTMNFGPLMTDKTLSTNLLFLHRGVLHPHSGIGQHFHNHCEEMFVIFDDEAEFTINGRTSTLKGTWGAPDRMGSSHAIYNPSDHDVEWMNINVGMSKVYDAFNLGDDRVGAPKDKIPQFVTMHLDKALLKPTNIDGVSRRRALGPSVFYTPWSYVDHVLIAPGASLPETRYADMSEAYYVISGDGSVTMDGETISIRKGDAIPVDLNQAKSFKGGSAPLELMIIGVAKDMAVKNAFAANPDNENPERLFAVINQKR